MDTEDKNKLDRILALAEENNEYIRSVHRSQKTSQMFKAIYWVVILALAAGSYYSIKPYLGTLSNLYSIAGGKNSSGISIPDKNVLQGYIKQLQAN